MPPRLKNDQAQVAEQQAVVDQKMLRAPFAGHLGIRAVDLGQYLAAGTQVVTLQALDPLYVDFYLPQQALANIKVDQAVGVHVDTWPGVNFSGQVIAINPQVDPSIAQRADPRDAAQSRPPIAARHVRHAGYQIPARHSA